MTPPPASGPTSDGGPLLASSSPNPGDDWPARAADLVEAVVSVVRDKTVRPATLVARAVVFGVIVLAVAVVVTLLVSIAVIRVLTVDAFGGRVWISDLAVGGLFVVAGMAAWSRRTHPGARSRTSR